MHSFVNTTFALVLSAFSLQLLPAKPAVQYVTLDSSVTGSGASLTLRVDITPKARIHVYGPGAKSFVQPSLKIVTSGVTAGTVSFPRPEIVQDPILDALIPMYTKTFRVSLPLKLGASTKPGETLSVTGVFSYQACDDKMCYPPSTAPVTWSIAMSAAK
jgi:hypothetical protein